MSQVVGGEVIHPREESESLPIKAKLLGYICIFLTCACGVGHLYLTFITCNWRQCETMHTFLSPSSKPKHPKVTIRTFLFPSPRSKSYPKCWCCLPPYQILFSTSSAAILEQLYSLIELHPKPSYTLYFEYRSVGFGVLLWLW